MSEEQQEMTQEEALAQVQSMINPVEETPHDPPVTKIGAGSNAQSSTEETPQAPQAQEGNPEAAEAGSQRSPEDTGDSEESGERSLSAADKYQQHLQRLLEQNREARQKQQETTSQQQEMEFARQLAEARKYGPEAVMKVLGIQQEQRQEKPEDDIDIRELLGLDDGKNKDSDRTTKELAAKINKLESFIQEQQAKQEQWARQQEQQQRQQQMTAWEQQEHQQIQQFLSENQEKYEYVSSLKELGSDKEVYDGIITMYQQGYQPSYDDMAQLIETRVEALAESLLETPKFRRTLEERLGVKLSATPPKSSKTLSGSMVADSATNVPESPEETEEQNLQRAMRAAMEAKSSAEEALKKRLG